LCENVIIYNFHSFIHSLKNLYSASSRPLLLRGAPDSSTVQNLMTMTMAMMIVNHDVLLLINFFCYCLVLIYWR